MRGQAIDVMCGKVSNLCSPYEEYLLLGDSMSQRLEAYRELFSIHVDSLLLRDIRESVSKGMVLGNDQFKEEIEKLTGRRVRPAEMGRPKLDRTSEAV